MNKRMKRERIIRLWRVGYFKLFDFDIFGYEYIEDKFGSEQEWKKLFWRIYWKVN